MGGVYRIQSFFGFLYFFYIYKAPKRTATPSQQKLTILGHSGHPLNKQWSFCGNEDHRNSMF